MPSTFIPCRNANVANSFRVKSPPFNPLNQAVFRIPLVPSSINALLCCAVEIFEIALIDVERDNVANSLIKATASFNFIRNCANTSFEVLSPLVTRPSELTKDSAWSLVKPRVCNLFCSAAACSSTVRSERDIEPSIFRIS